MKNYLFVLLLYFPAINVYADDLSVFQKYAQDANRAFKNGDTTLCFKIEEDIISLFNSNIEDNVKDKYICTIVFDSYCSLAFLDKRKSKEEVCRLISNALTLVEENDSWLYDYKDKEYIIQCYVNLIAGYSELGYIEYGCNYNKKMISFAEKHYQSEIAHVLLIACSMNSLMNRFDNSYSLYQRLYEMFDNLDKIQQYKVVIELIHFEFKAMRYNKVIALATKHEKLIQQSNDEIKDVVLDLIAMSFVNNVREIEDRKSVDKYNNEVDDAYKMGYNWAKNNHPSFLPTSISYWAHYKYKWEEQRYNAILLYYQLLDYIQNKDTGNAMFGKYCEIEDAQQAIISIIVTQILNNSSPIDIEKLYNTYNRVFDKLIFSKTGKFHQDLLKAIELAYLICYGDKTVVK